MDDPASTPAEELRTAASSLRATAKGTTESPWHFHDTHLMHGGHTATVFARPGGDKWAFSLVAWLPSFSHEPWQDNPCWHNARWSALAHPGLAEPLAAWLETEAKRWDDEITRDRPECPNCGEGYGCGHAEENFHDGGCGGIVADNIDDSDRCDCWDHALAVGRVINGGEAGA